MTSKAKISKLKDIKKALKEFPKIVREKEAAHREREKVLKPFMKVARDLAKTTAKRALNGSVTGRNDSTKRFSDRVENYVKYRPSYPQTVMSFLRDELHISQGQMVADVGSGTGIFTGLLLQNVYEVYAVEPNKEMRAVAENEFRGNPSFHSVDARAESTTLPARSIDLIAAAQAFHWFDHAKAKAEFQRILKPGGYVVLLWNERIQHGDPFHEEYEALIQKFGTDYNQVKHDNIRQAEVFESFFSSGFSTRHFENHQDFDFEGLRGRLLSSSYAPAAGHPNFRPMILALRKLFEKYARNERVRVDYDTEVYFGKI
jgi:ubiquinone/menaquinone biosynthesis C-methylase UbiE